jgi:hypothetical protein
LRVPAYICMGMCVLLAGAGFADGSEDEVVISEVSYDPDTDSLPFIELYNGGKENVDLANWRVRIASKNGVETVTLSKGEEKILIPGHGFYLIGRAADRGAWSESSYKPDFYCDLSMDFIKGTGGVILERPGGQKRDAVGWGPVRWPYYEGTQHPGVSRGHSLERKSGTSHNEVNGNSYDNGDNLNDLRERAQPQPQNINSPRESPAANTESNAWGRIKAMYHNQ